MQLFMLLIIISFIVGCCFIVISWSRKLEKGQDEVKPVLPSVVQQPVLPVAPQVTGLPEADEFLFACRNFIREVEGLRVGIKDEKLAAEVGDIAAAGRQICDFIEKRPLNARNVVKIVDYYYPTTLKLLNIYSDISSQRVKVKQMEETMAEIESTMNVILKAFLGHIEGLYEQKAIDVSSEIDVLKHMVRMEGLTDERGF